MRCMPETPLSNGAGNITVTTPDIAGASTFDLAARVSGAGTARSKRLSERETLRWLTNVARTSACANGVCTFTDTQAALQSYNGGDPDLLSVAGLLAGKSGVGRESGFKQRSRCGSRAWMDSAPASVVAVQGITRARLDRHQLRFALGMDAAVGELLFRRWRLPRFTSRGRFCWR